MSKTTQECHLDGNEIKLTFSEFETLFLLLSNPNRVYTRYQIVEEVHGQDYAVTDRSIDVMMVSIRKKLAHFAINIETIRGGVPVQRKVMKRARQQRLIWRIFQPTWLLF